MLCLEKWGNALSKISGMFAFCYIDQNKNKAFLVRDRYGQKPLYFSTIKNKFIFANEIKAILSTKVDKKPNYNEFLRFMNFSQYDNGDQTLFKNIQQLSPGCYIQFNLNNNNYKIHKWYNLKKEIKNTYQKNKTFSLNQYYENLNFILNKVSLEHCISDVPISLSLSGGLDASTLLASISNLKKNYNIRCNLINFQGGFSEEKFVNKLTKKYNQKYFLNIYKKKHFIEDFQKVLFDQEGFVAGLHNLAFENLYKHLNRNNMKVLLDGTGLDEGFGGYRVHHLHYLSQLKNDNKKLFNKAISEFHETWKVPIDKIIKNINKLNKDKNLSIDGTKIANSSLLREHVFKNDL